MRINGIKKLSPVVLASMLIIFLGSGFFGSIIPYTASVAYAATLKGDELIGKVITNSGKPVSDAQVQLLSPANTMMDVTTTDSGGRFTLDLGVLEDNEMKKLDEFLIAVSKGEKKTSKRVGSGASSLNDIVSVDNIILP